MSGQIKFYKNNGALQVKIIPPQWKEISPGRKTLEKEGAILLEVAPGAKNGNDVVWDWGSKITFAVGVPDVVLLTETPVAGGRPRLRGGGEQSSRVVHDLNGKIKSLQINPGTGNYVNTWQLQLSEKGPGDAKARTLMVPLSDGEHALLMYLFKDLTKVITGLV
jgi:hypothetical protein